MRISDWSSDVCSSDLTSRAHTALKIDPHYESATIWVKDASRAVNVAQSLVSEGQRQDFVATCEAEYAEIRERHRNRDGGKRLVSLAHARSSRLDGDWANYVPPETQRSEEHTSELQSLMSISYAVFCL